MKKLKNKKIILAIVIIVIAIAGISTYMWYNDQYDDNLVKASGYQKLGLKTINEDINDVMENMSYSSIIDKDSLKTYLPGFRASLNSSNAYGENLTHYLNEAKKYAKNDIEKRYIDLLLDKAKQNKKIDEWQEKRLKISEKYVNNEISLSEVDGQMENVINEVPWHNSKKESINNDIMHLLTENPEFKQHLINLGVDKTFLGENPN